ncbi:hypothetical protein K438DRAFT_2001003 [Mycena galopus ATCC 62051]|nr:hypothetical protein K438DRAFT_2001003 [Mycena galopus ATCC 62051]
MSQCIARGRSKEILLHDVYVVSGPFLCPQHIAALVSLAGKKKLDVVHNIFPGSAIRMVYDNARVFEVGQKMPENVLDVIGGHTCHPDIASITVLDQLVTDCTTFFPQREVVQAPLPPGESVLTNA